MTSLAICSVDGENTIAALLGDSLGRKISAILVCMRELHPLGSDVSDESAAMMLLRSGERAQISDRIMAC